MQDVVVELVAHFVKSLTSSEKDEKDNRDQIATEVFYYFKINLSIQPSRNLCDLLGNAKTVREILSLLTPSNFEEQLARMKILDIDSEDKLAEVTDLFFEKVFIAFNCSSTTNITPPSFAGMPN